MALKTCTGTTSQPYVHVQVRLSQAATVTATGADVQLVQDFTGLSNVKQWTKQVYPADEALAGQTSGGLLHSTGVPSNTNGNNNDWCISDNGHLYFKSTGTWAQKV